MNRKAWLLATAFLVGGTAQATCYSIYKADGTLLQQSSTPPVNLSLQIGDSVPEKFGPGATMTMSDYDVFCRDARERQQAPKSLADAILQEDAKAKPTIIKTDAPPADGMKTAAK